MKTQQHISPLMNLKAYAGDSDSRLSRSDANIDLIDEFIQEHASEQPVLFRGINVDSGYLDSLSLYDVVNLGNGSEPVSTSRSQSFARNWAEMVDSEFAVIFRIHRAKGIDLESRGIANAVQEREVLLHSSTRGFITGIEEDGYTVFVDVKIKN